MRKNEPYIRIMAIDPGLNALGISLGFYYYQKNHLVIQEYMTIHSNEKAKKEKKTDFKTYGNLISLLTCEEAIDELMQKWEPEFVVSEDAFYNPRMPNAFLSLKLCINAIQRVLYQYNKVLYKIPPTVIKQTIFGNGLASKAAVQEGIMNHNDIGFKEAKKKHVNRLVEHEADSIAIGYAFTQLFLPDILMQRKLKNKIPMDE